MKFFPVVCVVAAAALLVGSLGGCARAGSRRPAASLAAPAPAQGGILRLLNEEPTSLDPPDIESVYEALPVNQIFDGLVRLGPSLNIQPALAETWTISRDGTVYTFQLRAGVRFHDGTEVTAEDVAFTIRRALLPRRSRPSIVLSYLSALEGADAFAARKRPDLPGVEALDPRTVRIRLHRPYLAFLEVLALDYLRVVPRHVVECIGDDAFRRAPVGTGPFRLAAWGPSGLTLTANKDYFGGRPHLDEVRIAFPRPEERDQGLSRFVKGEIDAVETSSDALAVASRIPGVTVARFQELSLSFLGVSAAHPDFEDARVRQAIAHAIDRERIVAEAPSQRRTAMGILPPGLPGYSPQVKTLRFDPDHARRLLAEAGHPGGRGLKPFTIYASPGSLNSETTFRQIESDLRAIGLPATLERVSWAELARRTDDHDATAFVLGWIADVADPAAFLGTLFVPEGSANYFAFRDERVARLLEAGAIEMNPVERARIYREAERRILELAPIVPLFYTMGAVASRGGVHGLEPGPLGIQAVDFETVWIERAG